MTSKYFGFFEEKLHHMHKVEKYRLNYNEKAFAVLVDFR